MNKELYKIVIDYRLSGFRPLDIAFKTGVPLKRIRTWIARASKREGYVFPKLKTSKSNDPTYEGKKCKIKYFEKTMETRDRFREIEMERREVLEPIRDNPAEWENNKPIQGVELFTASSLDYIFKR